SMEELRKQPPNCRDPVRPPDRPKTLPQDRPRASARAADTTRGDCRLGSEDGPAVLQPSGPLRREPASQSGVDPLRNRADFKKLVAELERLPPPSRERK